MRKFFDYINGNVLVKVASLNSISVFVRLVAGFLTSKAIALFVGPEGLALIGNFRNFVSSLQSISILGLYNGVVKYVAEFKNNSLELSKLLSTSYYLGFISTILIAFPCYFFAADINDLIFPIYNDYAYVIQIFAIALPFYSLNMFTFSILNGFSKFKIIIIINILGQILATSITLLLIYKERIDGALISVAISESLLFLVTFVGVVNQKMLTPLIRIDRFYFSVVKKLGSFSAMKIFTAVSIPLVALFIRNKLIGDLGYKDAGHWEAMNRLSKYYLLFISSLMSLYILPRFSEIDNVKEFRKEVYNFYKTIMPIFGLGLLIIYFMRGFIVSLVFTKEFQPVEDLFFWQLLGDFIKVLAIVIGYQFVAKNMLWHYLIVEVFSVLTLYFSSMLLINLYGSEGAVMAHFITQLLDFGLILLIFSNSLFGVIETNDETDEKNMP